jgi:hypothetical protein
MAFYIKKQSILLDSKTVYYTGDSKWSEALSERKSYISESAATAETANPDGKNGGFTGSTIVEE